MKIIRLMIQAMAWALLGGATGWLLADYSLLTSVISILSLGAVVFLVRWKRLWGWVANTIKSVRDRWNTPRPQSNPPLLHGGDGEGQSPAQPMPPRRRISSSWVWPLMLISFVVALGAWLTYLALSRGLVYALGHAVGLAILGYINFLLVLAMGRRNFIFTIVPEGQYKIVEFMGKFSKCLISSRALEYKGTVEEGETEADRWTTVQRKHRLFSPFGGLHFVGIPPFFSVKGFRHNWTSIEQRKNNGNVEVVLVNTERILDYGLLQQRDIYSVVIAESETIEMFPLDLKLGLPTWVVNPYKAHYNTEQWLEFVVNTVRDIMRSVVAKLAYEEVTKFTSFTSIDLYSRPVRPESSGSEEKESDTKEGDPVVQLIKQYLKPVLKDFLDTYGIQIPYVQIQSADPGSKEAEAFRKASGLVFVAKQQAKADKTEGEGKGTRATAYYSAVNAVPGGRGMFAMERIEKSQLRAITHTHGIMPTFDVGRLEESEDKEPKPPTSSERKE